MLLVTKKVLFIHIPKTGGNSIQNVLAPFAEDQKAALYPHQDGFERFEVRNTNYSTIKHSTLKDYRKIYPEKLFNSLYKFTVIRNTYYRVMSYYFSPHRGSVKWSRTEFIDLVKHILPIRDYIGFEGQPLEKAIHNVDKLIHFDKLESEFSELAAEFDFPENIPHVNRGRSTYCLSFYDEELLEFVRNWFREEIEFFDFDFDIHGDIGNQ